MSPSKLDANESCSGFNLIIFLKNEHQQLELSGTIMGDVSVLGRC